LKYKRLTFPLFSLLFFSCALLLQIDFGFVTESLFLL